MTRSTQHAPAAATAAEMDCSLCAVVMGVPSSLNISVVVFSDSRCDWVMAHWLAFWKRRVSISAGERILDGRWS